MCHGFTRNQPRRESSGYFTISGSFVVFRIHHGSWIMHHGSWIMDLAGSTSPTQKMPSYGILCILCIFCNRTIFGHTYRSSRRTFETSELGKTQYNWVFCRPSASGREKADKAEMRKCLTGQTKLCRCSTACVAGSPHQFYLKVFASRLACQAQFLREVYDVTFTGGFVPQGLCVRNSFTNEQENRSQNILWKQRFGDCRSSIQYGPLS